jgi:phosphatidylserine/phosphatidylglycerophosphate/cardiolipin synthase-like enzyme
MMRWALPLFLAAPLAAAPQTLFTPGDNIEQALIAHIQRADLSIDAAVYELTSPRLRRALLEAAYRGVSVRVLMDARRVGYRTLRNNVFVPFLQVHVARGRSPRGSMHHKFAVFDGQWVATGSYNWTPGAQHINFENLILEDDRDAAASFTAHFQDLWRRSRALPAKISSRESNSP